MAKDKKPEKSKTKTPVTTPASSPAPAKSIGKRKTGSPEQVEIIPSSANGTNSNSKSKSKLEVENSSEDTQNGVVLENINNNNNINNNKKNLVKNDKDEKESSTLYQIPMSRVSRIIKSEDPSLRITQEAIFIINKASEKFLQVFATEAYANAFLDRKKHIDYKNLSSVVSKRRRFDFLSDFVPEKVKAEDALKEVSTVEI